MKSNSTGFTFFQTMILMILGVFAGLALGILGTILYYQRHPVQVIDASPTNKLSYLQTYSAVAPNPTARQITLSEDGVYLYAGGISTPMLPIDRNGTPDLGSIPVSDSNAPVVLIRGSEIPIGKLQVLGYKAGFGLDCNFSQSGATVMKVFDDSAAGQVGLQPGDLITKVDGEKIQSPMAYQPGHADIFGLMSPAVNIEGVRGSQSFTFTLPRNYIHHPQAQMGDLYFSQIHSTVNPRGDYVEVDFLKPLASGVYQIAVGQNYSGDNPMAIVSFGEATATPTAVPVIETKAWYFRVK